MACFNIPYVDIYDESNIASIARVGPEFSGMNGVGAFDRCFRAKSFAWFAQDNWRPRSHGSVNLGVRFNVWEDIIHNAHLSRYDVESHFA
jgi:hypothetical protein